MKVTLTSGLRLLIVLTVAGYIAYIVMLLQQAPNKDWFTDVSNDRKATDVEYHHSKTYRYTRLEARRQLIRNICADTPASSQPASPKFIVNRREKLVYCDVPKAGSSFWKSVLALLDGDGGNITSPAEVLIKDTGQIHTTKFTRFNSLTKVDQNDLLENGQFLMFVRDPYMRLLSAYFDKFVRPNKQYWQTYGKMIVNYVRRSNDRPESAKCGHDVTFPEFIRFFIISQTSSRTFNIQDNHWTPIYKICRPCEYTFKYIGKTEFSFQDTKDILLSVNVSNVIQIDHTLVSFIERDISRRIAQFLKALSNLKHCTSYSEILRRFWIYLMAKGYIQFGTPVPQTLSQLDSNGNHERLCDIVFNETIQVYKTQYFEGSPDLYRTQFAGRMYSDVSDSQMRLLKDVVKPDCLLFGYDIEPDYIFDNRKK